MKEDFYPIILAFKVPLVVERKDIDDWYHARGSCCKVLHISATASGGPGDDTPLDPSRHSR